MDEINWIDGVLLAVVIISVLVGMSRGFAREVMAVVSWVVSLFVAYVFGPKMAMFLGQWIEHHWVQIGLAYLLLAVGTLIVMGLVSVLLSRLVKASGLGGVDKVMGMMFGIARGILIAFFMVVVARALLPVDGWSAWQSSRVVPRFMAAQGWSFDAARSIYEAIAQLDIVGQLDIEATLPSGEQLPVSQSDDLIDQDVFFKEHGF